MKNINKLFKFISITFLSCLLMSSGTAAAGELGKVKLEILIDSDTPGTFYTNVGGTILEGYEGLTSAPVPGATFWLKGDLYEAGTINPLTLEPRPSEKIGEWYCTGTRVVSPGGVFVEEHITYRFNDGTRFMAIGHVVLDGTPPLGFSIGPTAIFFSSVAGVNPGDEVLVNPADGIFIVDSQRYRLLIGNLTIKKSGK